MGERLHLSGLPGVVRDDVQQGRRYPLRSFVTLRRVTVTRAAHCSPVRARLRSATGAPPAPDANTAPFSRGAHHTLQRHAVAGSAASTDVPCSSPDLYPQATPAITDHMTVTDVPTSPPAADQAGLLLAVVAGSAMAR